MRSPGESKASTLAPPLLQPPTLVRPLSDRGRVIPVASDVQQEPEAGDRAQQLRLFGERVRELRLKAGMRQSDLADKAGLDRIAISNIERGLRDVGVVRATAIARALGVRPGDLFPES